jgi:hypothetical protein
MSEAVNFNQSRVRLFRRCQKQYAFRYDTKEGKEMVPKVSKLPLYRGTWMHALQEALHYQWAGVDEFKVTIGEGKTGVAITARTWKDVHAALEAKFESLFEEEREELGDLPDECKDMFKRYLRFWKEDQSVYSVVNVGEKPAIELVVEVPLDDFGLKDCQFKGRIDLVVEDDEYGGAWIWDAKWVGKIPVPDERMMSPQAPLYVWALRKQYGLDVRGFVYNYGRTKPPAVPRLLKRGVLSTRQTMDTDQYTYFKAIKRTHGENYKRYMPYYKDKLMALKGREALWFDRQRTPIEDSVILAAMREYVATVRDIQRRETRPDYVPRSYFYNCKFSCSYHSPCVAQFAGNDITALLKQDYQFTAERYTEREEDLLNA